MAKKTFIAGEDLTGKFGYALKANDGKVEIATEAGEVCFGILMNDNKEDLAVGVALTGEVCKAKLGGAVAMGQELSVNAQGKFIALAGDVAPMAKALEAGAENDLIYVVAY